ncbi:MAG: EAL domain-containing protein [Anaerolineaceae bacterium]|nr:EAL domain-containing protein [Anaerolineaceae bacterium]
MKRRIKNLIELFAFKPRDFSMNPLTLSFCGENRSVEEEFLKYYFKTTIRQTRFSHLFGFIIFALLGITSILIAQESSLFDNMIYLGSISVAFLGGLSITFLNIYKKIMQTALVIVMLISVSGLIAIQTINPGEVHNIINVSLVLIILFSYSSMRMRFKHALLGGLFISLGYGIATIFWVDVPKDFILSGFCYLETTIAIGLLTSYTMEYVIRRDYFEINSLSCDNEEALMLNSNLQQIVSERTHELSVRETELDETRKRLEHYNTHDILTGLPNLALLQDRLEHALKIARRKKSRLAVVLLNLDDFKSINNAYSFAIGDMLLKAVTNRLLKCVRESDTVARVGIDEFAILLEGINDIENISNIVKKIIKEINSPFEFGNYPVIITASSGISVYPETGETVSELLRNAGSAINRSKVLGGNVFHFFSSEMAAKDFEKVSLINQMRVALENHEFKLYYQPQVDLKTGKMMGVEALLRWDHPKRGLLYPGDFILIAEKCSLITSIGSWVLSAACRQNKIWQDTGLPKVKMSVNVSERQLRQNLVDLVKSALDLSKLDPEWLELEFRENIVYQNIDRVILILKELKELGVSLAIDDFGAGFSTLSNLAHFPFSTLKIDRSLASQVTDQPNDAAIVNGIVGIASKLGMKVIAEGVETRDQICFYEESGCNQIQGWYFSKAVPDTEVPKLLSKNFELHKK